MSNSLGPILDIVKPYLKGKFKRTGNNIITLCPFHDDHKPSFWLNINNGLWLCFSCGLKGSLKSFLKLSGVSRDRIDDLMDPVQVELALFHKREKLKKASKFSKDPYLADIILPEALLGVYEYKPRMMIKAGFDPKLLRSHDIGYDRRLDRVTFPIRDLYGNLAGISGRSTIPGSGPRYKVYRGGYIDEKGKHVTGDFGENFDEDYTNFEINSHRFLWNSHNVYPVIEFDDRGWDPVIVTEGFKACLWLVQHGFETTVALMGASISEDQKNLLVRMSGNPIILFLDNDEAGRTATVRIGEKLSKSVNELLVALYPEGYEGKAPDDLKESQIRRAIFGSEEWRKWRLTKILRRP